MASTEPEPESKVTSERILTGILALLAADREDRVAAARTSESSPIKSPEVVLATAGLSPREIAGVLGKPHEAVRSTLRRDAAKKAGAPKAARGNGGAE
jgi:DNA-directed RNA polymerase specialized sigma24 family protein